VGTRLRRNGSIAVDAGEDRVLAYQWLLAGVYYRVADEAVFALCEQVCGSLQVQLATLNAVVAGTAAP
jgi:hypothetical protein